MPKTFKELLLLEFPQAGYDAVCREKATKAVRELLEQKRQDNIEKQGEQKFGFITFYNGKIKEDEELLEEIDSQN